MPNITASRRNHQSPPSKSGRRFLCLNLSGVAKSVAIRRDRTQWFQSRGREFESLCAHTICRQNSLQNLNTFMTLDVHFCESVPIMMQHGFVLPYGDARAAATSAYEAEQAGWDGFFVWDAVWGIDAWVALTAAAMLTERIRLGTLLSPISRMRPWQLA